MGPEPIGLGALEVLVPEFAGVSAAVVGSRSTVGHDGPWGSNPALTVPLSSCVISDGKAFSFNLM